MRCRSRAEGGRELGTVTAEFAVAMPAIILVLAACLSGVQIAGQQLRLQDAAAAAARSAGRSGDATVANRLVPGSSAESFLDGPLVCVRLRVPATTIAGSLLGLQLSATSCALGGGR